MSTISPLSNIDVLNQELEAISTFWKRDPQQIREYIELYEQIGLQTLNTNQVENYTECLLQNAYEGKHWRVTNSGGYFHIASLRSFALMAPDHPGLFVVENICKNKSNPDFALSDEQMEELLKYERSMFKVHVNVDPDQRAKFIREFAEADNKTRKIRRHLAKSTGVPCKNITDQQLIDAGAQLIGLAKWKFTGFQEPNELDKEENQSDFVFYVKDENPEIAEEKANLLISGLSSLVQPYESKNRRAPFYSNPFTNRNRYSHPTLSLAQGNTDTKVFLENTGKLNDHYNLNLNHYR